MESVRGGCRRPFALSKYKTMDRQTYNTTGVTYVGCGERWSVDITVVMQLARSQFDGIYRYPQVRRLVKASRICRVIDWLMGIINCTNSPIVCLSSYLSIHVELWTLADNSIRLISCRPTGARFVDKIAVVQYLSGIVRTRPRNWE